MSSASPERWLLVCHAFNMDGVAASQTVTDKLAHLAASGVDVIALTAPTGRRDSQIEHHQVFSPLPSGLRYELRHWFKQRGGSPWRGLLLALLLPFYLVEKILAPFGSHWSWWLTAYPRARRIVRERAPRLIWSSGGANSAHLTAYLLARRTGLPWIAEVHDPMIHDDWKKGPFQYRWAAFIEKLICSRADVAIWFTPEALRRARVRHPSLGDRGKVMYPGANPPPHDKIPWQRGTRFVLAHFGSLATNRNLVSTLAAIEHLFDAQPQRREQLVLRTYGGSWDEASERALASFRHSDVVEKIGRLERDPITGLSGRERVLRLMDTCDTLLLLHGEDAFCEEYFPSKLYEYLWTQRPILGLVVRNADLETFLRKLGHSVARGDNAVAIAGELENLLQRWEAGGLNDNGARSGYSTQRAVHQLIEWGCQAIAQRSKNAAL